jgi:hypothetical protein
MQKRGEIADQYTVDLEKILVAATKKKDSVSEVYHARAQEIPFLLATPATETVRREAYHDTSS